MMKIFNKIKSLFYKKQSLYLYTDAATIPEAFGLPEPIFGLITNDLFILLSESRVSDFSNYLESETFKKYRIDLTRPNYLVIIGFAFAVAISLQKNQERAINAQKVISKIYDEEKITNREIN